MKGISAIICAYNEEKTVKDVIKHVYYSSMVSQIVVVNDGSTDSTKEIIDTLKDELAITAIHLIHNKGKGYAMAKGVEEAFFDVVIFIDADQRIISEYINHLLLPILKNDYDMVLGYSTVSILNMELNPVKILTGERALYRQDLIPILEEMKDSRFGVETLLYFYYKSLGKSLKFIHLKDLKHNDKYKKMPRLKATIGYFNEGLEIVYTAIRHHDLLLKTLKHIVRKTISK
ncbi:MAG: glycosyltransferase [Saprospiraceae bacterium]|nr:glycosyltransferase [Saprospiraceae bacterium]MBP7679963.1 glycosyltransferase [Saprospiraceae bacterium]